ncbi:MAG: RNA polymerase sigma factor [Janthinobacterium lividum]
MTNRAEQDARHREAVGIYYQTHDEAALGPMLGELREQVLAYLRGRLGVYDTERAEDLAQQSITDLLAFVQARKVQVSTSRMGVLLCVICKHLFLKSRHPKPSEPGRGEDPYQFLPASTATPAQELPVAQEEQQAATAMLTAATQAVLGLDPNARAAVVLHFYHGLPAPTAAAQLGISEGTFRERLSRGLQGLQAWGRTVARPAAEVYAALPGLDTGDLFREPLRLAG